MSVRQYQPENERLLPVFLVFGFLKIQDFAGGSPQTSSHKSSVFFTLELRATAIDSHFSVSARMDSGGRRRKREPPKREPKGLREKGEIIAPKARTFLEGISYRS